MIKEDKLIAKLSQFKTHPEFQEALQLISKSKLKSGKEKYVMLEKAKHLLYPYSGTETVLHIINDLNELMFRWISSF